MNIFQVIFAGLAGFAMAIQVGPSGDTDEVAVGEIDCEWDPITQHYFCNCNTTISDPHCDNITNTNCLAGYDKQNVTITMNGTVLHWDCTIDHNPMWGGLGYHRVIRLVGAWAKQSWLAHTYFVASTQILEISDWNLNHNDVNCQDRYVTLSWTPPLNWITTAAVGIYKLKG